MVNKKVRKETHINNIYAVKLMASISSRRLLFMVVDSFLGYFEWLFMEVFFVKLLVSGIEEKQLFHEFLAFLLWSSIVFCVIMFLKSYYCSCVVPQTDIKIEKELYSVLYKKARNVELACYEKPDFYSKYTMAMDDAAKRLVNAVNTIINIFWGMLASVIAMIVIFYIEPFSCIFVAFPLIGNFVMGKLMNKVYYGRYVDDVRNARVMQYVNRVMHLKEYSKEMRYSGIYSVLMQKFKRALKKKVEVMRKYGRKGMLYMSIKNILTFPIPFEGVMTFAVFQTIIAKSMQLSDLAVIYSTMATTSWILIGVFNDVVEYTKHSINIGYLRGFLEYKEKIPENLSGKPVLGEINSIEFCEVSFGYNENEIIHKLSFQITKNQTVALVGCNGAGKSTIIKLLLRLYDPTSGKILVNGTDIRDYDLQEYRKLFSVTFQDYKIMGMSIRDNISMGDKVDDVEMSNVIHEVGLAYKIKEMKRGMETTMTKEFDDKGVVLSGGEQQKIILARAFVKKAAIQIFDEPSSALDPLSEHDMYQKILCKPTNGIKILISHRLSTVKDVDKVILIDNKTLHDEGKHEQLLARCRLYKQMYNSQAKKYMAID